MLNDELVPMLCFPYWKMSPREQAALWKDGNDWVAQEKFNGVRIIIHFVKGVGIYAHLRSVRPKTGHRTNVTDRLLFGDYIPDFSATIDAEAIIRKSIVTNGKTTVSSLHSTLVVLHMEPGASKKLQVEQDAPLAIQTFDITNWQGAELKKKKLCERLSYIKDFRDAITAAQLGDHFAFPGITFQGKRDFFDLILAAGGEGVVIKNLNSRYEDNSSRLRFGWIKVKRACEFDAFVSGFEAGKPGTRWANLVACLLFSVHTERGDHLIAKITGIPEEFRKKISIFDQATGKLTMHPGLNGKTARVDGVEISARALRLSHARILYWCKEVVPDQCHYSMEAIRSPAWGEDTEIPFGIEEQSGER